MHSGLSIIIVNYNSTALLVQCLRSFAGEAMQKNWEIIVVDNDSKESPEQHLKEVFQNAVYIQMGYNAGFARANNKGITIARFNTILLLNADTIADSYAISLAYEQLVISNYVACGVQLLNLDGSNQIAGSRVMQGGLNYLLLLPYLGAALGWLAKLAQVQKPSIEQAKNIEEVDWINGAFLMVKRDAIQSAGMLDEDFFLYMEEIEWCSRLKKQGKLVLYGNLNVTHLQGETTKEFFETKRKGYQNLSDKMGRQLMLSIWVRQRKQFGVAWFFVLIAAYGAEMPIFFLFLGLSKLIGSKQYSFTDATGYAKNYFTNLSYIFQILRNRPFFYKVV